MWFYKIIAFALVINFINTEIVKVSPNQTEKSQTYKNLPWDLDSIPMTNANECWESLGGVKNHNFIGDSLARQWDACGLMVKLDPIKNRTVHTTRQINQGEYVCEYTGRKFSDEEFIQLENDADGDYMFGVEFDGKQIVFDAIKEDGRFCRLINHSRTKANVQYAMVLFKKELKVIFITKRDIIPGEELLLSYQIDDAKIREIVENDPSKYWYWD